MGVCHSQDKSLKPTKSDNTEANETKNQPQVTVQRTLAKKLSVIQVSPMSAKDGKKILTKI